MTILSTQLAACMLKDPKLRQGFVSGSRNIMDAAVVPFLVYTLIRSNAYTLITIPPKLAKP